MPLHEGMDRRASAAAYEDFVRASYKLAVSPEEYNAKATPARIRHIANYLRHLGGFPLTETTAYLEQIQFLMDFLAFEGLEP